MATWRLYGQGRADVDNNGYCTGNDSYGESIYLQGLRGYTSCANAASATKDDTQGSGDNSSLYVKRINTGKILASNGSTERTSLNDVVVGDFLYACSSGGTNYPIALTGADDDCDVCSRDNTEGTVYDNVVVDNNSEPWFMLYTSDGTSGIVVKIDVTTTTPGKILAISSNHNTCASGTASASGSRSPFCLPDSGTLSTSNVAEIVVEDCFSCGAWKNVNGTLWGEDPVGGGDSFYKTNNPIAWLARYQSRLLSWENISSASNSTIYFTTANPLTSTESQISAGRITSGITLSGNRAFLEPNLNWPTDTKIYAFLTPANDPGSVSYNLGYFYISPASCFGPNSESASTSSSGSISGTSSASESISGTVSASESISGTVSASESISGTVSASASDSYDPPPPPNPASASASESISGTHSASISGTSSASESISGTVSASESISGTVSASESISGTHSASISGTSSASESISGTVSASESISGTVSASESISGTHSASISGTSSASESISGTVSASESISGTHSASISGTSSASESISGTVSASESNSGTVSASESISGTHSASISGTSSASESISGTVSASESISGTVSASESISGTHSASISGTSSASESISGTVSASESISGTVSASESISGTHSASISGTSSASESISGTVSASESNSGTVSASESISGTHSASISGTSSASESISGTVSASESISGTHSGSISGTSSASESISGTSSASESISGTSSASESISGTHSGSISGTVSGSISGTVSGSISGTASESISGTASESISGTVSGSISGTVSGSISGTASESISGTVSGSISGTVSGSISGTASESISGTASASRSTFILPYLVFFAWVHSKEYLWDNISGDPEFEEWPKNKKNSNDPPEFGVYEEGGVTKYRQHSPLVGVSFKLDPTKIIQFKPNPDQEGISLSLYDAWKRLYDPTKYETIGEIAYVWGDQIWKKLRKLVVAEFINAMRTELKKVDVKLEDDWQEIFYQLSRGGGGYESCLTNSAKNEDYNWKKSDLVLRVRQLYGANNVCGSGTYEDEWTIYNKLYKVGNQNNDQVLTWSTEGQQDQDWKTCEEAWIPRFKINSINFKETNWPPEDVGSLDVFLGNIADISHWEHQKGVPAKVNNDKKSPNLDQTYKEKSEDQLCELLMPCDIEDPPTLLPGLVPGTRATSLSQWVIKMPHMGDGHGIVVPDEDKDLSDGFFVANDGDGKNDAIQPCETPVDDCPKKPVLAKPSVTESAQCLRATPLWFNFNLTEKVWIPSPKKHTVNKMWNARQAGITKVLTYYYGKQVPGFNGGIVDPGPFGDPNVNLTNYLKNLYDHPLNVNNFPILVGIDENAEADNMDYINPPENAAWEAKNNYANIGLNSIRPFMGFNELSYNDGGVVKGFSNTWNSIIYYDKSKPAEKPYCLYSQFNQYNKERGGLTTGLGLNFGSSLDENNPQGLTIPLYPILVKDYKINDNTNGDRYLAGDFGTPEKPEQDVIDEELEPLHTQCWYGESEIMACVSSSSKDEVDAHIDRIKISVGVGMYMTNDGDGIKIKPEVTDNEGNINFDTPSKMAAYINIDFGNAWVDDNGQAGNYAEFIKDIGSSHEFAFTFDEINKNGKTLKLGMPAEYNGEDEFGEGWSLNQTKNSIRGDDWAFYCSRGLASLATWSSDQMITDKNIISKFGKDNLFELHYWRIRKGYARFPRNYSTDMNTLAEGGIAPPRIDGIDATYQTTDVSFIDSDGADGADTVSFEIDKENFSYNSYREADGTITDKIGILIRGIIRAYFTQGEWGTTSQTLPLGNRVTALYRYGTRKYKEVVAFGENNGDYGLFAIDPEGAEGENIQVNSEGIFSPLKDQVTLEKMNNWNPACMYYYGWSHLDNGYALDIYSYMHRGYRLALGPEGTAFNMLYLEAPDDIETWGNSWDSVGGAYKIVGDQDPSFKQGRDITWPSMSFPVISYSNEAGQDWDKGDKND